MADLHETQQEKEARWATQRAASNAQDKIWQTARSRARTRNLLIGGAALLIIVVLFVAIKLL
jgi:type II secretory pathway component PulM